MEVSLEGRVAVVTGAGRGLGRAEALELARRGAAVVVNDVVAESADAVVAEIVAAGGKAAASHDSVATREGGQAIVDRAVETYGTVDVVVSNAGVFRPSYFEDLTPEQLHEVLDVHLLGAVWVCQPAWRVMKERGYGRIVLTSSSSGLYGHQANANYGAAKAGLYGLCKALAFEGEAHGIVVNTLLPSANSKDRAIHPLPEFEKYFGAVTTALGKRRDVGFVAELVAFLSSERCTVSGEAFSATAGVYKRVFVGESDGWVASGLEEASAEAIAEHLPEIRDIERFEAPMWAFEEQERVVAALERSGVRR